MMARRDFAVDESFHRLKRTLLLFCTAVLIARLPGISFETASSAIGVKLNDVSTDLVITLLWFGAIYYGAGFVFEVKAAFEANTGLSRHSSAEDIRERIERALQDFTGNAQRVSTIAHELALYRSRIEQRLDVKDSRTDRLLTPHLLSEADIDEVRNELLALSTIPAALINLSDQAEDYAGRFTNGLDRLSRDIRKLSEDVSATQTWQFVGWETIPSVAVFIAATIAAPRPDVMVKAIQSTMPWF